MAVQVSKSGGIYIEISGDYTQLQADLKQVDTLGKAAGKSISDALSGSLRPNEAARSATNLSRYLATAQRAAKALTADLSGNDKQFREMGRAIGVAESQLGSFVKMQRQMYQTQSQKAFENNLKGIQRLTGSTDAEMNRLAKSLGGVGNEFSKASSGIKIMGVELGGIAKLAAGGFAAAKIAGLVKESFDLAARYETLGVVVQQVGKSAGYSAVEIDKNVSALRRMGIAGIEARKTMTQLIQAQVDITKTPALARIAQDAAVIGGINSSESFERMVHGIQAANTQVLRGIGINVNFEQSYAKLAASLGKTTSELTEQEKVQARVNAVTEAGEKITGAYEASMGTLGKQISSLDRVQQDFLTDTGNMLLELGKAAGFVDAYAAALDTASRAAISARASQMNISQTSLDAAFEAGGTQAGRELIEGFASAKKEAEDFSRLLAALKAKGENVEALEEEFKKLSEEIFGAQERLATLERTQRALSEHVGDTSAITAEIQKITQAASNSAKQLSALRERIASLFSLGGAMASGTGADAHVQTYTKTIEDQHKKIEEAYAKTGERAKQLKLKAIDDQREALKALVLAGKYTKEQADKMDKAFAKERDTLTKGSRSASLAADRTSYQAAEAAQAAADSLKNLQLQYSQLAAQIDGNSLGAALARSQRDYATQIDAIAKKEAEIAKNRAMWAKEGKMGAEASASLDAQQKYLNQEKEVLLQIKAANDELARRADLEREARAAGDLAGLIGDLRGVHRAEVDLLEVKKLSASETEKQAVAERIRIAQARASLDVSGMLETGMAKMAEDAQRRVIDFWEKTIPESIGAVTDTFGTLFADIATGTKSASDAFADMGKTFQNIANQIIADLINMTIRMVLFNNVAGASGAVGSAGGIIGSVGKIVGGLFNAQGNAFSAASGLSAYRNSIVTAPTVFAFAKGGVGLMGEKAGSPGEAIMPLTRTSTGDLGVQVDLGGGRGGGDTYFYFTTPITVEYAATESSTPEMDGQKMAESLGAQLRKEFEGMVNSALIKQSRPGGLLNSGIGA